MSEQPTIREIMDPAGTLPPIELLLDPNYPQQSGTLRPQKMQILSDGELIGSTNVVEDTKRKEAWLNGVLIAPELRGKGFGLATYLAAIEYAHASGETFRSHDWTQTEKAVRVWEKFIKAGVAQVVEPFKQIDEIDGNKYYSSHLRIPPQENKRNFKMYLILHR